MAADVNQERGDITEGEGRDDRHKRLTANGHHIVRRIAALKPALTCGVPNNFLRPFLSIVRRGVRVRIADPLADPFSLVLTATLARGPAEVGTGRTSCWPTSGVEPPASREPPRPAAILLGSGLSSAMVISIRRTHLVVKHAMSRPNSRGTGVIAVSEMATKAKARRRSMKGIHAVSTAGAGLFGGFDRWRPGRRFARRR